MPWMTDALRPRHGRLPMSPTWIWIQIAIVVLALIGMLLAITKLA
jgi:hypothetical protein